MRSSVVLPHRWDPGAPGTRPRGSVDPPVDRGVLLEDLPDVLGLDRRHRCLAIKNRGDLLPRKSPLRDRQAPRIPRRSVQCPSTAPPWGAASGGWLEQLALLPLGEDVLRLRLGFLDRVLGAHHSWAALANMLFRSTGCRCRRSPRWSSPDIRRWWPSRASRPGPRTCRAASPSSPSAASAQSGTCLGKQGKL